MYFVNTSEVAVFIGQNKYDIVKPFERLWRINDKQGYNSLIGAKPSDRQRLETALPSSSLDTTLVPVAKIATVTREIRALEIPKSEQDSLITAATSVISTEHGISGESAVLDTVEKTQGIVIDRSQNLYKRSVNDEWTLCGRVDGIAGDTIIEIKNRIRGFFGSLRDYERTQVQLYMWLVDGTTKVMLEQHFEGQVRSTEIFKDIDYISDVLESLSVFLGRFQVFMSTKNLQEDYSTRSDFDKRIFVNAMIQGLGIWSCLVSGRGVVLDYALPQGVLDTRDVSNV